MNHEQEHLELGKKMLEYARLKHYDIEPKGHNDKIYFITYKGERKYELWEVSGMWSVSDMEQNLMKKHEEFYFAVRHLVDELFARTMDDHFGRSEE
jgi:hypothetical protein